MNILDKMNLTDKTVFTKIENFWGETLLKPGEILCPVCNGSGRIIGSNSYILSGKCKDCDGDGKVDWTRYILIKNRT